MTFLHPWVLGLNLLIVAFAIWQLFYKKSRSGHLQYSQVARAKVRSASWRVRLHRLPQILLYLSLMFTVIALARPQKASQQVQKNIEGIDIMIAFDISDSMLIEDMQPVNRLEASKKTIGDFIQGRPSDRIGLVVFAGEAYTRMPLTLDHELLLKSVRETETTRNIKMGTAIGVALATAVARIKDSEAKSRVIIFLTDGENNSGTIDPETALKIAVDHNVKIYSIGQGVDGQAQLPVYLDDGRGNKIKQYRPMHSQINEPLLRSFAEQTGGRFWRATTGAAMDDIFREIDRLEKTKIDVNQYVRYEELYQKYLVYALWLLLLSQALSWTWLRRFP